MIRCHKCGRGLLDSTRVAMRDGFVKDVYRCRCGFRFVLAFIGVPIRTS